VRRILADSDHAGAVAIERILDRTPALVALSLVFATINFEDNSSYPVKACR
jgi:hypothetical protein